jgi:hypothetical protein
MVFLTMIYYLLHHYHVSQINPHLSIAIIRISSPQKIDTNNKPQLHLQLGQNKNSRSLATIWKWSASTLRTPFVY